VENLTIRGPLNSPKHYSILVIQIAINPMEIDGFYNQGKQNILFYREWKSDIFPLPMTHSDTLFFGKIKRTTLSRWHPLTQSMSVVVIT
jgi:hypothetical protein